LLYHKLQSKTINVHHFGGAGITRSGWNKVYVSQKICLLGFVVCIAIEGGGHFQTQGFLLEICSFVSPDN